MNKFQLDFNDQLTFTLTSKAACELMDGGNGVKTEVSLILCSGDLDHWIVHDFKTSKRNKIPCSKLGDYSNLRFWAVSVVRTITFGTKFCQNSTFLVCFPQKPHFKHFHCFFAFYVIVNLMLLKWRVWSWAQVVKPAVYSRNIALNKNCAEDCHVSSEILQKWIKSTKLNLLTRIRTLSYFILEMST